MSHTAMKVAVVYFSATNNTRTVAQCLQKELEAKGCEVTTHDITTPADRSEPIDFAPYQAVLFGFPIHSLRAPRMAREWLQGLDGLGKKCAMFFTYGGFLVHPAHESTRTILNKRGFTVIASAEFPGAHTFNIGGWKAFPGRPDNRDAELMRQYADAVYVRFKGEDDGVLGEQDKSPFSDEQLDQFESYRFMVLTQLPARNGAACSLCGLCEKECPTGAMDAEKGLADPQHCIACLRCVFSCPEQVLQINDTTPSWEKKLAMGKTTEEEINSKTGAIYL